MELNDCKSADTHEYSPVECSKCGHVFCFACCGYTNVHQGGKYVDDKMTCPNCGHDYYEK